MDGVLDMLSDLDPDTPPLHLGCACLNPDALALKPHLSPQTQA